MYVAKKPRRKRMPTATHGLATARNTLCRWWSEMAPTCFIPCESMESPATAKTVTPASTRYLRKFTRSLGDLIHNGDTEKQRNKMKEKKITKDFLHVSVPQ